MAKYVRDEKGDLHTHVHGVLAEDWFATVAKVGAALASPESGIARLVGTDRYTPSGGEIGCEDPDCGRLNRTGHAVSAVYVTTRDLIPVRPTDPTSEKERRICEGHPWKAGSYLCGPCARMAQAKRLLDSGWKPPSLRQEVTGSPSGGDPGDPSRGGDKPLYGLPTSDGGKDA